MSDPSSPGRDRELRLRQTSTSPLWWSVPQRIACAAGLIALLWLVIAWAAV